jgi:hypothetical protein
LEVVVALAVVAIALVPLMRLHLLSLDATLQAQDLTTAVLLAQGQLAALGAFPEEGEESGKYEEPELNRFHWQTVVTKHTIEGGVSGDQGRVGEEIDVRHIVVTVLWADGQRERRYTLEEYATASPTS